MTYTAVHPRFLSYPLGKAAGTGVDLGCTARIRPTMNRTIEPRGQVSILLG